MKKFIFNLFIVMSLVACSNDDDSNNDNDTDDIFITYKVNGTSYTMEPYTASSMKINIGAEEGIDNTFRSISLSMPLEFTEGEHGLVDSFEIEDYTASYTEGDITVDATAGTLTITSVTNEYIEGTFNFTAEDDEENTYNISEGSFKAYKL